MLLLSSSAFWYWVKDVCEAYYSWMNNLMNGPAILFIIIGFVGVGGWLIQQVRYNIQAEKDGTIK